MLGLGVRVRFRRINELRRKIILKRIVFLKRNIVFIRIREINTEIPY